MPNLNELTNVYTYNDSYEYVCSLYLNNINKIIYLFGNSKDKGTVFIEPFSNIKFVFKTISGSRWTKETLTYLGDYNNNAMFYCACKKFKDSNDKKFINEVKDYLQENNVNIANYIYEEIEKQINNKNTNKINTLVKK